MGRAMQAVDWRQRKSVHAAERDTQRVRASRAAILEAPQTEDLTIAATTNTDLRTALGKRLGGAY